MSKSKRQAAREAKHIRKHENFLEKGNNRTLFGPIKPRNKKQQELLEAFEHYRIVIASGLSGVGKSMCAMSWAIEAYQRGIVERIVITRPMVGCDEEIGFLPGTEDEKYIGWVGPMLEIAQGKLGKVKATSLVDANIIDPQPLMRMRGSTFRNTVVILDEAQNTTEGQMKMFLTRLGEGSKVFILGDEEQSDLPRGTPNGLSDVIRLLGNSRHVAHVEFSIDEVTRDPLVREILLAYRRKK